MLVSESMVRVDAGWRMRSEIIRNLVYGESLEFFVAFPVGPTGLPFHLIFM